jgi:transcriptional regulator with XRE-family HTH domain
MKNRIRELRKARGLTLKELARRVDTSNQQISHLETGKRRLTVGWLERIATALDCHPLELLDEGLHLRNERERALVELYRGLSEEQQDAFFEAVAALAKPLSDQEAHASSVGKSSGRNAKMAI